VRDIEGLTPASTFVGECRGHGNGVDFLAAILHHSGRSGILAREKWTRRTYSLPASLGFASRCWRWSSGKHRVVYPGQPLPSRMTARGGGTDASGSPASQRTAYGLGTATGGSQTEKPRPL